uniref:Bores hole in peptidoglycan layer allowing type IV secretion complex assembly to occur (VirB1) n=1 Tax=Escherichia coli TaxID=562 RepID=A0A2K9UZN8_ECOLX|nr:MULTISPECIES: hypothetical protein [Enterobacteriaceae]AUV50515.1 Bores hole in peptidoglycan layer allowing type IV secretion complex assembly to occur (VirB1) [Escherichia coli]
MVPSVKDAIRKENVTQSIKPKEVTVYPQYAMRGTVLDEKETNDVKTQ